MASCHPLVIIPCVAFQGLDCPSPLSASSFPRGGCSPLPPQGLSPTLQLYRYSSTTATGHHSSLPSPHAGFCRSPPVMVAGGRVFVLPCIQQIQRWVARKLGQGNPHFLPFFLFTLSTPSLSLRISLNTLTLNVKSEKVYTRHGVPISVTGIAQVRLSEPFPQSPLPHPASCVSPDIKNLLTTAFPISACGAISLQVSTSPGIPKAPDSPCLCSGFRRPSAHPPQLCSGYR